MTTERKIIVALSVVILVVAAIMGKFMLEQKRALDNAAATTTADEANISRLQSDRDARDKTDALQQRASVVAQSEVKTSADAVKVITRYLPSIPANALPAEVVVAQGDLSTTERAEVADAPSYVLQTQDAALSIAKNLIACDADRQSLAACKDDLKDADAQTAAQKHESSTWQAVAKGGTKTHRFLNVLKCVGTSAAGAAAGAVTKQTKWAVVGAGAGVVACQLF
jgi:hypothetical protein